MNRLKELRQSKGLTFKELSTELLKNNIKISPDALAKYEREERKPKIDKWEALAHFYNVPIPYLQGIEPDFAEVTEETKDIIAKTLNEYYFGKVEDYELGTADNLKKSVDKYLKLKKVLRHPSGFYSKKEIDFKLNPRIKKYWLKHFSFLFEYTNLIKHINSVSFNSINERHITLGEARLILYCINEKISDVFKTEFGEYFEDVYLVDSDDKHEEFDKNLLTVKNIKDLDNSFLAYRSYLDDLHKKLKSDLENDVPAKREQEAREEIKKLLAERKNE